MNQIADLNIFTPASHHDVLALIFQFSILLLTARVLGEIAQRLHQPSVVGEIFAGILLGPSLLSGIFPKQLSLIVPHNDIQGYLLEAVSLIGAMFLLLVTGLEIDLKLIKKHAKTALGVSCCGILVTFVSGFILGQNLPDFLLADKDARLVFSLFIAISMSISAIPVIAKVLIDLKLTRRDIGQTIIAAGMSDDTIGWILLSIVVGIYSAGAFELSTVMFSVGKVGGFIFVSFTIGQWLVNKIFQFVQDKAESRDAILSLIVIMAFLWGSVTQKLQLEAVLGAFVMGVLFSRLPRLPEDVGEKLESMALSIFAPVFFAVAGLKVNIQNLLTPKLIGVTFIVIGIACFGKVIGTYLGARLIGGRQHWESLSFGAALNARGAMEIIVATIGLSLGILNQEMFSIIVVMAITTSLLSPFALHWVLKHVKPGIEEKKRLEKEEFSDESDVLTIYRVLVPVRHWDEDTHLRLMQVFKSGILGRISRHRKLSITLLNVQPDSKEEVKDDGFIDGVAKLLQNHDVRTKILQGDDIVGQILKECEKDYELLVLGASQNIHDKEFLFSRIVDSLIKRSPCQTLVAHTNNAPKTGEIKKILVPTNGSDAARNAVEFGFMIGSEVSEKVHILHVLEWDGKDLFENLNDSEFRRRVKISADMLKPLKHHAKVRSVNAEIDTRVDPSPEKVIVRYAKEVEADLIVLGVDVKASSERLFLGPRIEYILKNATCPVIIINS